jgi:hypothetical protein
MIYRKKYAYVLAIHGCPVWPVMGMTAAEATALFGTFDSDGGEFAEVMSAIPQVTQTLDATGGFSRMSDNSFEFIDDGSFTAFFGANRIESVYTYMTDDLTYSGTTLTVEGTGSFSAGDVLYLPRETIEVDSVDSGTAMTVSRSLYSAFRGGSYPTYNAIPPQMSGRGPDVVLGGHWNHAGRWVCLYQIETNGLGIWQTPVCIYAGVISEVSMSGRKVTLQTRSITTLLTTPIVQQTALQLDAQTEFYPGETMDLVSVDGRLIASVPALTAVDTLFTYLELEANTNSETDGNDFLWQFRPTYAWVQAGGATLPGTEDCISRTASHPALVEYLDIAEAPTGSSGIGWRMDSTDIGDWSKWDGIAHPGGRFMFREGAYIAGPFVEDQYFLFDNGERKLIIPCTYDVATGYWYYDDTDPWFDEQGNELADQDRHLCVSSGRTSVYPILAMDSGNQTDLLYFLNQVLISTGESIAPSEDGNLNWYQAYGIPYHLVNYNSFVEIGYRVKPLVWEAKSVIDLFEPGLKISGYRVIFDSSGRLAARQMPIAAAGASVGHYTSATTAVAKPDVSIGYQAPLTSIVVDLPPLNTKTTYNMANPQSSFTGGNELQLTDTMIAQDYAPKGWVAYNNLYWLSNTIPSCVITVDAIIGQLGDVVTLDNYYIPGAAGYGVTDRTALQTEIQIGNSHSVRLLLAGNLDLDAFCLLAPAGRLDTSVGDHGLDGDQLFFTDEFEGEESFVDFIYEHLGSIGPMDIMVRAHTAHFTIEGCTLDLADDAIDVPAGFAWPAGFGDDLLDVDWYVTVPEYHRAEA